MKLIAFTIAGLLSTFTSWAQAGLISGGMSPAGAFQIQVQGGPLQIEFSTNLTAWLPSVNGRGTVVDAASTNSDWRFYRAKTANGYASNVIGYARVTVEPGKMALVASPFSGSLHLDQPAGRTALFGTATPAVQVSLMQNGKQTSYTFDEFENNFTPKIPEIPWGTAFIVRNNSKAPIHVNFSGDLPQGNLKRAIPHGEALIAPLVPKPGPAQDALSAVPMEGAQIMVWNEQTQAYQTSTCEKPANRWIPSLNYKPGRGLVVKYPEPSFQRAFSATQ